MQRIRQSRRTCQRLRQRCGFTTPAVAVALLVFMMGLALILDRIWLETAQLELKTASEAAALAAAKDLASDNLLRPNAAVDLRLNNALQSAGWIAGNNVVAGSPLELNLESDGDVRFGNLVNEANRIRFEESTDHPTTVVITGARTRSNNNPVGLFVAGVTGIPFADVVARAEATIDNFLIGLRAFDGTPIPALPIAIWRQDSTGQRSDTWNNSIETKRGADAWSFDPETRTVVAVADGIPEITLHGMRTGGNANTANVQLMNLGTGLVDREVIRQFDAGISVDDLKDYDGQLWVGNGASFAVTASPELHVSEYAGFQRMIGECRICFLYADASPQRQKPLVTSTCVDIVAIRVMAVTSRPDGSCDITVQPTVITTRTAVLASECASGPTTNALRAIDAVEDGSVGDTAVPVSNSNVDGSSSASTGTYSISNVGMNPVTGYADSVKPNRYLYKMRLTH